MSYEAMHKVRASGLTDRTQVDVLEALAFFHNGKTGACFPSTEAIARISRVNDRTVRLTLKVLHDLEFISSVQMPGQKRYFTLHLDRLPTSEAQQEPAPLQEITGGEEPAPLQEITGERCKKLQGTPVKTYRGPLQKLTPEQGINKESNKEGNKEDSAPAEGDTFNPSEWALKQSPKNGTHESTENGTLVQQSTKSGTFQSTENGTTESTKNGTHESTVFGPVTRNKNKEKEQGIGTGSVAPSTDHFPDATKKIEEPKPKRTTTDRGSRLTITELPDDWKAFAEQEEPDLDPKRLFENFKDYWNGLSGAKAIKKDWKGTWRNFVRSFHNAEDWKRRPMLKRAPTHSPSRPGQFVEKKQSERDYFDW